MSITVLLPENLYSAPLRALLEPLLPPGSVIRRPEDGMENLENRRLLFAVALDPSGCNLAYYGMLQALRGCDTLLRGSVAGVIVTGVGEFYTKDVARDMVFAANQAGCAFLGRPLVEATGSLRNFRTQAQIGGVDEKTAFRLAVGELVDRLAAWRPLPPVRRVLALHASQRSASNTLARATAPSPTATGAAIPPACTSASRAAAFTAAPWWRRCTPPSAGATPW